MVVKMKLQTDRPTASSGMMAAAARYLGTYAHIWTLRGTMGWDGMIQTPETPRSM